MKQLQNTLTKIGFIQFLNFKYHFRFHKQWRKCSNKSCLNQSVSLTFQILIESVTGLWYFNFKLYLAPAWCFRKYDPNPKASITDFGRRRGDYGPVWLQCSTTATGSCTNFATVGHSEFQTVCFDGQFPAVSQVVLRFLLQKHFLYNISKIKNK